MAKQLLDVQQRIPQARPLLLRLGAAVHSTKAVVHGAGPKHSSGTELQMPQVHTLLPTIHISLLHRHFLCKQVTAELQRLEAQRASSAEGSAPLRAELRRLEAQVRCLL